MNDPLSICCGSPHDERFPYDDEYKLGLCSRCLEHTTFEEEDDDD